MRINEHEEAEKSEGTQGLALHLRHPPNSLERSNTLACRKRKRQDRVVNVIFVRQVQAAFKSKALLYRHSRLPWKPSRTATIEHPSQVEPPVNNPRMRCIGSTSAEQQ